MMTMAPRVNPRPLERLPTGLGSCAFMIADTARVTLNVPVTLTSIKRLNIAPSASAIGRSSWAPIYPHRLASAPSGVDFHNLLRQQLAHRTMQQLAEYTMQQLAQRTMRQLAEYVMQQLAQRTMQQLAEYAIQQLAECVTPTPAQLTQ